MTRSRSVVVLGGYGNFGARICRALALDTNLPLVVAARHLAKAQALAASLGTHVSAASVGTSDPDLVRRLTELDAGVVIHTAGPFQSQDWRVPLAAAEAGAHYIDLADGRRWVCDFPRALNDVFGKRQLLGVTGASTVPALSSAVVDSLQPRFLQVHAIELCIAPAQQAPRGTATLAAVLSYCGEPIRIWRDGAWTQERGWSGPRWVQFARMKPRRGALCDIPDLELFTQLYVGVQTVMFRAALEVGFTQWMFAMLAKLRGWHLVPNLRSFAGFMHRVAPVFDRFGTPLGGMVVRLSGKDASGVAACVSWHVTADDFHGPEIPCMAAVILARRLVRGDIPAIGAHACMGLVSLPEFAPEFARWGMVTDLVTEY